MIKFEFEKGKIKADFKSLITEIYKSLSFKLINNKLYISDGHNEVDYKIFFSSLIDLESIFNEFNKELVFPETISRKIGLVYYCMNFYEKDNSKYVNFLHICKDYIDIDINALNDDSIEEYYISSIIINNFKYPEINKVTTMFSDIEKVVVNDSLSKHEVKSYCDIDWEEVRKIKNITENTREI